MADCTVIEDEPSHMSSVFAAFSYSRRDAVSDVSDTVLQCCGQMASWIKMPLGMEVGLGQGDFVLDRDPAPPPQKGSGAP